MTSLAKGVVIVGAKRTPFGKYGGKYVKTPSVELQTIAAKAALESSKVKPELIDSITIGNAILINEAFAAQTLACIKDLQPDMDKLNVDGGAVAIGHPLGASGARIITHLVYELRRRKAKLGIGSACIGGGQGIAILIESL